LGDKVRRVNKIGGNKDENSKAINYLNNHCGVFV
jgi:hypothetical protein